MPTDKVLLVVNASKFIERFSSAALSSLLDIDLENSKTLSNKTSALSFKQKLDLLTDIRTFDKKELPKFQNFTEIRNQFAHNFNVHDFKTCLSFIDGGENFLKKNYPQVSDKDKSHEDYLFELFTALFNDIISICGKVMDAIKKKIEKEVGQQVTKKIYESLIDNIKAYAETNPEFQEFYNKTVDELQAKSTD